MPFDTCVAAVAHADGTLEMFGADGFRVCVVPREWRNGVRAVEALISLVPPERLVRTSPEPRSP